MIEMILILLIGLFGIGFIADHFYNREKIDRLEKELHRK